MVEREIRTFLDRRGFTVPEYHVMQFVHYACMPPDVVVQCAAGESEWWNGRLTPASRAECGEALGSLIAKGVLQIVDHASLDRIREILDADPAFGPFDGLPKVGNVDFTEEGGALCQEIERDIFHRSEEKWTGFEDVDVGWIFIATSEEGCRRAMTGHAPFGEVLSISEPEPIGPWRDRWWGKRWETGFRIVILYRPGSDETAIASTT